MLWIYHPPVFSLQTMTNNVGLTFVLVTLYCGLQLVISKAIKIGGTK